MSSGDAELLFSGTSVGFYRAVKIKEKQYKHIRITVTDAIAPPVLRCLGLHYFEDMLDDNTATAKKYDLAKLSTTKIDYSEDRKQVTVAFGGIYPFNFVEAQFRDDALFLIERFNGTQYRKVYANDLKD